ncbi:cytochrome c biogenesis CcdA family protein [Dehalogenimonas formicexedens]|uniref:cytochrome c biogenesis CcdA family protein n=1 Tax=Dehalogenimonas formicexedens TaxID=1839801 RepID=UPI003CCCD466
MDFWAALGGGILSFLSPCVLPMVPVYLASLAGPEFLDARSSAINRRGLFLHSLSFVAGFSLVFTALGALAAFTGTVVNPFTPAVRYISGTVLVLLGLYMLAAARFPQINFEKRLDLRVGPRGYMRSFLTGAVFTVAWTPCVSPILASILTLSMSSGTAWQGSSLLGIYSLGLGIPFLAVGLAAGTLVPLLRRLNRLTLWFYVAGGIALISVGGLIILGKLNLLAR